jgi:hypothetical protein
LSFSSAHSSTNDLTYASFFGKPFNTFPTDAGVLVVFSLP